MTIGVYPGSFDPVTYGHIDIMKRAANVVDQLVVGVLNNNSKSPLFSVDERVNMIKEVTKDIPNIKVVYFSGLAIEFARANQAKVMIRGLRAFTDFDSELQIAQSSRVLAQDIDTIFLATSLKYAYVSSSTSKEIAFYGGDVSPFVPPIVERKLIDKFKQKRGEANE